MNVPIQDTQNRGELIRESDEETFNRFLQNVEPLITSHPDHSFDLSLSLWFSHTLYENYNRWRKSPDGIDKPKQIQVIHLLKLWKSEVGKDANVRHFISILEKHPGTKDIIQNLEKIESSRVPIDISLSHARFQNEISINVGDRTSDSSNDLSCAVSASKIDAENIGK